MPKHPQEEFKTGPSRAAAVLVVFFMLFAAIFIYRVAGPFVLTAALAYFGGDALERSFIRREKNWMKAFGSTRFSSKGAGLWAAMTVALVVIPAFGILSALLVPFAFDLVPYPELLLPVVYAAGSVALIVADFVALA